MNKIAGAILILAAAISGHGVFVFVAAHPRIHKYDIPDSVAKMVLVAIGTSVVLGLWGMIHLLKNDSHH
jgi:hypothetical protein